MVNFGFLSSYSDAFNISNSLVIIILLIWRRGYIFVPKNSVYKITIINIILLSSLITPFLFNLKLDLLRFLYSLIALNLMFMSVIQVLPFFYESKIKETAKSSAFISFSSLVIMLIFILTIKNRYSINHYLGFTEISHFALCSAPLFLFSFYYQKNHKIRMTFIALIILVGVFTPNLSMLMLIPLFYLIKLNFKSLFYFLLLLPLAYYLNSTAYFQLRLSTAFGSEENLQNLSGLVFIQGWEFCLAILNKGFFWGIGFQQMGLTNILWSDTSYLIEQIAGQGLSVKDGSFFFSKLFVEFGIIIILILFLFLFWYIRLLLSNSILTSQKIFFLASSNALIFILFIRGMGYFNFGVFWALLFLMYHNNKSIQNVQ